MVRVAGNAPEGLEATATTADRKDLAMIGLASAVFSASTRTKALDAAPAQRATRATECVACGERAVSSGPANPVSRGTVLA